MYTISRIHSSAINLAWIFYISAGEFCNAALKALLSVQRASCDRFFSAMGRYYIAELEKATAQMVTGV